ncbi:hypothetical protein STAR110904_09580 [Staphylococcus argensis]
MLRKVIATMITGVIVLSLMSVAQAHVTLNPDTSEPGSYEKYDVRVPVEKDANTNKIELEVPKGVEVVGVAPDVTFDHHFTKDKKDNIKKSLGLRRKMALVRMNLSIYRFKLPILTKKASLAGKPIKLMIMAM